jgi:hypothetical protein
MAAADADLLQQLLDIELIKQLKARYFRLMDTKQWDDFRELFTDDAVFEGNTDLETITGPPALVADSADRFVAIVRERLSGATTVHHGHMAEIQVIDAVSATGIWAMADLLERPNSAYPSFRGYGHYHERYRKEQGQWRIAACRLTRLKAEAIQPG